MTKSPEMAPMNESVMGKFGEETAGALCLGIECEVEDRLSRSGYLALRDVSCHDRGGVIVLRGRLPSQYLKQVAQTLASGVEGVNRVVNLIKVSVRARERIL
jgi:hypothetical protein